MNFTYNNHIKYYIDGNLFGYRENSFQHYKVEIGKIDKVYYRKTNFRKELLRTADLIYQDLGKDLAIFLSGGTDSEIVLRNFLSIGVKPKCFIIRFKDEYNAFDVQTAVKLATDFGVDFEFIDFDVKDFFYSGEASEFGKKLQCTQITYLTVYKSILKMSVPSIMGGELLLKKNINTTPSSWYYCLRENEDCSSIRFSLKYQIPLVNEYFSYTPELMLTYLENSEILFLVNSSKNYKLSSVSNKNSILKELLPEIEKRKKTHGFEKLLALNFIAYRQLTSEQILRLNGDLDGIEFTSAINMLRGRQ